MSRTLADALNLTHILNLTHDPLSAEDDWSVSKETLISFAIPLCIAIFSYWNVRYIGGSVMANLYLSNIVQAAMYIEDVPQEIRDAINRQLGEGVFLKSAHPLGLAVAMWYLGAVYDLPYNTYITAFLLCSALIPPLTRSLALRILIKTGMLKDALRPDIYNLFLTEYDLPMPRHPR